MQMFFMRISKEEDATPRAAEGCMLSGKTGPSRCAALGVATALLLFVPVANAINLSRAEAMRIGRKVWQNECGGTVAGLTSWNSGENFASLGIGHFIWYPRDQRGPFEESFPKLVEFVSARGAKLPEFLLSGNDVACPWNSRAEFLRDQDSPKMK